MKRRLGSKENSPPAGYEPETQWSEIEISVLIYLILGLFGE